MTRSSIYSLNFIILVFYGNQFIWCSILNHKQAAYICLAVGLSWEATNRITYYWLGLLSLCYAIWLTRNDFVLNKRSKNICVGFYSRDALTSALVGTIATLRWLQISDLRDMQIIWNKCHAFFLLMDALLCSAHSLV